jgi:hypothetical protein
VTYPYSPQPAPRPGPPPGGFGAHQRTPQQAEAAQPETPAVGERTGHPAVDAVLQSLANATRLAPADQIAEYEAAHRVLQETLASIDG